MPLYRFMAEVRAGADHPYRTAGERGIVTIWVRAESERTAFQRAQEVMKARPYGSAGELTGYLEEAAVDPSGLSDLSSQQIESRDSDTAVGYDAIKQAALDRGDGLFEAWFPGEANA